MLCCSCCGVIKRRKTRGDVLARSDFGALLDRRVMMKAATSMIWEARPQGTQTLTFFSCVSLLCSFGTGDKPTPELMRNFTCDRPLNCVAVRPSLLCSKRAFLEVTEVLEHTLQKSYQL